MVAGEIRDGTGAIMGYISVSLGESRRDLQPRTLQAGFSGPSHADPGPLWGRVQDAILMTESGVLLRDFEFTPYPSNSNSFVAVLTEELEPEELDALWERFESEQLYLDLRTGLYGYEYLRVPLRLKGSTGWQRAGCT